MKPYKFTLAISPLFVLAFLLCLSGCTQPKTDKNYLKVGTKECKCVGETTILIDISTGSYSCVCEGE